MFAEKLPSSFFNYGCLLEAKAIAMRLSVQYCILSYDRCYLATASNVLQLLANQLGKTHFSPKTSGYQGPVRPDPKKKDLLKLKLKILFVEL